MTTSDHDHGPAAQGRVLVVDDELTTLKNLRRILEKEGYQVSTYSNSVRALELLKHEAFDVLLSDLSMPHLNGLELLDQAKLIAPGLEVIIITGYASLDSAVEATKKGAYHFLAKPFTPEQVRRVVAEALGLKQTREAAQNLELQEGRSEEGALVIGRSPQMRRVAEVIAQIAPTDCNVFILGESGTGKELAARALHAQSQCAQGPFVAFNCAALNAELMENELFGHEKGAFTGAGETKAGLLEAAQGGAIFLDEIGEMPLAMQVKLLRALQEREVLRAVDTLTAGVAHELNNPMNNITLTAHMLQEDYADLGDEERLEMINDVVGEASRAKKIISNLLDFARESGSQLEPLDLPELLRETIALASNQIKLSGIKIDFQTSGNLPRVHGDSQQLRQVFLNLILNAIDASSKGGQIQVLVLPADEPNYLAVKVIDSGSGIPAHILPSIFDPFFTTKGKGKGTGLGLSVSQGIVAKHGGRIMVSSQEGQGATFTVVLPVTTIPAELGAKQ